MPATFAHDVPLAARAVAWGGGTLFVAALAACAWFFTVALARPDVPGWPLVPAIAWNAAVFGAFAAHHSVMARTRAKAWITRVVPRDLERSLYVWTASLLLLAVFASWAHVAGVVYTLPGPLAWLGLAAQAAGVWLTIRGAGVIAPLELAGIRQVYGDLRPARFRIVGPFRRVRHPIYLGWVLIVFGAPHMTVDRLVWAVITVAYLVIAIPFEERSLVEAIGDEYRAYRARVRWRLIPGLWWAAAGGDRKTARPSTSVRSDRDRFPPTQSPGARQRRASQLFALEPSPRARRPAPRLRRTVVGGGLVALRRTVAVAVAPGPARSTLTAAALWPSRSLLRLLRRPLAVPLLRAAALRLALLRAASGRLTVLRTARLALPMRRPGLCLPLRSPLSGRLRATRPV